MANAPSGIYKIENTIDGKCYVGSAINIKSRWQCHVSMLSHDKHNNKHLQRAWNKYGSENFTFSIILYSNSRNHLIDFSSIELPAILILAGKQLLYLFMQSIISSPE